MWKCVCLVAGMSLRLIFSKLLLLHVPYHRCFFFRNFVHGQLDFKEELFDADFPWTIVDGYVCAIGEFIPRHPGGTLIRRAIGEDATELFHTHHTSEKSRQTLIECRVGRVEGCRLRPHAPHDVQRVLNSRVDHLVKSRGCVAESVALTMLVLFVVWAILAYVARWYLLNVIFAWFWWRHLDAGLHSVCHGDFRSWRPFQKILLCVYSHLSHRTLNYYYGDYARRGLGSHDWAQNMQIPRDEQVIQNLQHGHDTRDARGNEDDAKKTPRYTKHFQNTVIQNMQRFARNTTQTRNPCVIHMTLFPIQERDDTLATNMV